jgi:hypothetical protein
LIITAGGVVLAVTSAQMVTQEALIKGVIEDLGWPHEVFSWSVHALFIAVIVFASWVNRRRQHTTQPSPHLETV